jgi:hypothetical protein
VDATPVPVRVHDSTNELRVGDVGKRRVFAGAAGLEGIGRCGEGRVGECQSDEGEELHVGPGWAGSRTVAGGKAGFAIELRKRWERKRV